MKVKHPFTTSGSKLGIALVIVSMVISSPLLLPVGPAQVSAATPTDNLDRVERSSGYRSTPLMLETSSPSSSPSATPATTTVPATTMAPAALGQDGDFTTQAALTLTRSAQTNNFVNSKAYYDISFRTATAGAIKKVVMDFPAGTSVGSALIVEATGIGPGTLAASAGEVLTYTVTNAVNIPTNTIIRIQMSNINNPPNPSASLTVSITTRDSADAIIDGPTNTQAYNIKQIVTTDIANGAVTNAKIAPDSLALGVAQRPGTAVNVPAGMAATAVAGCLAGESLVAGGIGFSGNAPDFRYLTGFIDPGPVWQVSAFNADTSAPFDPMQIQSVALCVPTFP